jgi:hypothetical protein
LEVWDFDFDFVSVYDVVEETQFAVPSPRGSSYAGRFGARGWIVLGTESVLGSAKVFLTWASPLGSGSSCGSGDGAVFPARW